MDGLWNDMRHSARALIARPGFTLVAVLTLGLGVGATTAMFSAVNAVLIRPLPYEDAQDIVVLKRIDVRDGTAMEGVSASNMRDVAAASQTLSHVSVADPYSFDLMEDGRATSLRGWMVSVRQNPPHAPVPESTDTFGRSPLRVLPGPSSPTSISGGC